MCDDLCGLQADAPVFIVWEVVEEQRYCRARQHVALSGAASSPASIVRWSGGGLRHEVFGSRNNL